MPKNTTYDASKLMDNKIPLTKIVEIEFETTETNERMKHEILENEVKLEKYHKENLEKFNKDIKLTEKIKTKPQKDFWKKLHVQGSIKNIERERIYQENRISKENVSLSECTFQPLINHLPINLNSRNTYNRLKIWNTANKEKLIK